MPGDPAYADLDEATKSALLDLAIGSPEAHQAAATVIGHHGALISPDLLPKA